MPSGQSLVETFSVLDEGMQYQKSGLYNRLRSVFHPLLESSLMTSLDPEGR